MRVLLEDGNGGPIATVDWAVPDALRDPVLVTDEGVFVAHRQDGTRWVYRYARPKGEGAPRDAGVSDWRRPDSPIWDGPVPDAPVPDWHTVRQSFDRLPRVNDTVATRHLWQWWLILEAAWFRRPYRVPTEDE